MRRLMMILLAFVVLSLAAHSARADAKLFRVTLLVVSA